MSAAPWDRSGRVVVGGVLGVVVVVVVVVVGRVIGFRGVVVVVVGGVVGGGGVGGGVVGGGVHGRSCVDLWSSQGGWNQVLQSSLHPSKTVLSVNLVPLAPRVFSFPVVVHLNSYLRAKETAAEVAALSPLSAVVCDLSMDSKVVLPMAR